MNIVIINIPANAPISETQRKLGDISGQLAREWFDAHCRNTSAHYHLYYRPSNAQTPGQLIVDVEEPEGFQLADARRLSPAWTVENAQAFIRQAMSGLPILPVC